jgi:hypothetical protein
MLENQTNDFVDEKALSGEGGGRKELNTRRGVPQRIVILQEL